MKGTIIKKFRDKVTKSVYAAGDTIERDEARIAEINKAEGGPFIVVVDDAGTESEKETSGSTTEGEADDPGTEDDPAAAKKTGRTSRSKKAKE